MIMNKHYFKYRDDNPYPIPSNFDDPKDYRIANLEWSLGLAAAKRLDLIDELVDTGLKYSKFVNKAYGPDFRVGEWWTGR